MSASASDIGEALTLWLNDETDIHICSQPTRESEAHALGAPFVFLFKVVLLNLLDLPFFMHSNRSIPPPLKFCFVRRPLMIF